VEVLFAVTGIAPVERDFALWKDRKRPPLVTPNEVELEPGDVPVIPPDGEWGDGEKAPLTTYLDKEGSPVCRFTGLNPALHPGQLFARTDQGCLLYGGQIELVKPEVCRKLALSGLYYWEYFGPKPHYGVSLFRKTDYVVEVSQDGQNWVKVAEKRGICGEDGPHVHRLPAIPIRHLRVRLDARDHQHPRNPDASMGPGLTWLQLFR
jgi:hypothetical protein